MYNGSGRIGVGIGAGGAGGTLAYTGFPVLGLTLIALAVIVIGLCVLRIAVIDRPAAMTSEAPAGNTGDPNAAHTRRDPTSVPFQAHSRRPFR